MNRKYELLLKQIKSILDGEKYYMPCFANTCAAIYENLPDINWVGFYFLSGNELVLSFFQGKPACSEIPLGNGVCGTAAKENRILVVPNVRLFRGYIACDADSESEIVVPLHYKGKVIGVLDADSPVPDRFGEDEKKFFSKTASLLEETCDLSKIMI